MSLEMAAGTASSVIFAASNLPMLIKARRTRDLSSYSLSYLLMNNVGNLLYCVYVFNLPAGPIWAMQSFYLLTMALLLSWYLRFTPPLRARLAQPTSPPPAAARRTQRDVVAARRHNGLDHPSLISAATSCFPLRRSTGSAALGMSNSRSQHRHPHDRTTAGLATTA
jgi:hypothetical protein